MTAQKAELKPTESAQEASNVVDISDKVGLILSSARKQKELSVIDASKALHIRVEYLTAFEKDDYDNLPSISYAQGFLKAYATFLGLDGNAILAAVREKGHLQGGVKHFIPQPIENNIVPSRTIVLGTLAVLVLLIAVWGLYALQTKEAAIPTPELPATVEAPVPPAPKVVVAPAPQQAPAITEEITEEPITEETTLTLPEEDVVETLTVKLPTQQEVPVQQNIFAPVTLNFSDEVWMQLRAPSGKVYVNKVFKAGDSYTLPVYEGSLLDVGKPSAVKVFIGGNEYTPWPTNTRRVIKGLAADSASIMQTYKEISQ